MSELKLLNCPFCGAEAELMIFNSEYGTVTVGCTNEDCDITMGKAFFTDKEAIEHWNRRKPMANIVEKLEEYAKSKICDNHKKGCPYGDNDDIFCENCGALGAINIVKQEINNGLE